MVTVVTTGATAPVIGASVLVTVVTTGAAAPVTGSTVFATGVTTGATALSARARVFVATVATGATAPVTGARVVAVATGVTVVVAGASVWVTGVVTVVAVGTRVLATGAATGARVFSTGATVSGAVVTGLDGPVAADLGADAAGAGLAEAAVEVTDDVAELIVEATGDDELAVDASGDVAEATVEVTVEPTEDCVGVSGGSAAVAAWAGRENTSMIARSPAAASAAFIATRAMRRATGCGMKQLPLDEKPRTPVYPTAAATNVGRPDLLFGHHRTTSAPTGQGRTVPPKGAIQ